MCNAINERRNLCIRRLKLSQKVGLGYSPNLFIIVLLHLLVVHIAAASMQEQEDKKARDYDCEPG